MAGPIGYVTDLEGNWELWDRYVRLDVTLQPLKSTHFGLFCGLRPVVREVLRAKSAWK